MPKEVVGKIPDFSEGGTLSSEEGTGTEEVKEPLVETPEEGDNTEDVIVEKETPPDLPMETKPAEEGQKPQGENTEELDTDNQGLLSQREKLLAEIRDLRSDRRELRGQKKEPLIVEQKQDTLDDIDPEYAKTIERVIKAKGYVTKDESNKTSYESIKKVKLDEFLEKYPEYKPENDPDDINWNSLQKELSLYKMPSDPHSLEVVLKKAHSAISKPAKGGRATNPKKLETARLGSGGEKRPSSQTKCLTETQKNVYRNGGWSEEEIKDLET